jgi:CcmD family protein
MAMIRNLLFTLALAVPLNAVNHTPAYGSSHISVTPPVAATGGVVSESPVAPGRSSQLYHVMGIVLLSWCGIALYLFLLDRKVSKLERKLKVLVEEHGSERQ